MGDAKNTPDDAKKAPDGAKRAPDGAEKEVPRRPAIRTSE
jgi:hypothetical protein